MLAFILLFLGFVSRLIIHLPNFTPVIAIALFSGVYLKKNYAILLPLALMMMTDFFLGFHETIFFTWGSIVLIAIFGLWVKKHKSLKSILGSSLFSAVFFFLITNFGVWLVSGMYPYTLEGFIRCFVLAIPFFKNTLLSTLIYTFVLFWAYEYLASLAKKTRFAHVLL